MTSLILEIVSRPLWNILTVGGSRIPDFYVVQTEAWVIYPWEMKEFTFDFANKLAEQNIAPVEIKNRLLHLGLPMHYAGYFLKQWQTVDGHRTRGKEPRRDE
jgi:hypothetical protein